MLYARATAILGIGVCVCVCAYVCQFPCHALRHQGFLVRIQNHQQHTICCATTGSQGLWDPSKFRKISHVHVAMPSAHSFHNLYMLEVASAGPTTPPIFSDYIFIFICISIIICYILQNDGCRDMSWEVTGLGKIDFRCSPIQTLKAGVKAAT